MNRELEMFLAATDLDEALSALRCITSLDAEDVAVIRSVLAQWRDAQAISNLLIHPTLIPQDIRLGSLFRGLAERGEVYYVLAAVVGFQKIDPAELSAADRGQVVGELLEIVRKTKGTLAQRASVSLTRFISEADAPCVLALWAHPDGTVWHNLRAWLFRTFQTRGVEPFASAAHKSGLSEEAKRRLVEAFSEFVTKPEEFNSWLCELYGYIPNLRDVERSA